jgi:hypothetical protein
MYRKTVSRDYLLIQQRHFLIMMLSKGCIERPGRPAPTATTDIRRMLLLRRARTPMPESIPLSAAGCISQRPPGTNTEGPPTSPPVVSLPLGGFPQRSSPSKKSFLIYLYFLREIKLSVVDRAGLPDPEACRGFKGRPRSPSLKIGCPSPVLQENPTSLQATGLSV